MIGIQSKHKTDASIAVEAARPGNKRSPVLRLLGNLLIAAGLLLMLGVGGYLVYQQYSISQAESQINAQHQDAPDVVPHALSLVASDGKAASPAAPVDNTVHVADLAGLNTSVTIADFAGMAEHAKPPTKVEIPSVGINAPVVPVGWEMIPGKSGQDSSRWKVAEYAAGHHDGTANPGQVGNVVISGHVDWKGEVFKNLHEVKRGDEVHIYTDDREYLYIVQDIQYVLEDGATDAQKRQNARFMDPTPDQTLTLITCFPYGIDDHRLIVIAKPYDSSLPARPDLTVR
ncbi:MAG: sortase [Chloroflexia bacterium]